MTAKTAIRFFLLMRRPFLTLLDEQPAIERQVLRALARRFISDSGHPPLEVSGQSMILPSQQRPQPCQGSRRAERHRVNGGVSALRPYLLFLSRRSA